jgi:hypothetical protein
MPANKRASVPAMAEIKAVASQEEFMEGVALRSSNDISTDKHVSLWHSVRRWRRVVGYCLALSSVMLLYGYDFVIVGTVSAMPTFQ